MTAPDQKNLFDTGYLVIVFQDVTPHEIVKFRVRETEYYYREREEVPLNGKMIIGSSFLITASYTLGERPPGYEGALDPAIDIEIAATPEKLGNFDSIGSTIYFKEEELSDEWEITTGLMCTSRDVISDTTITIIDKTETSVMISISGKSSQVEFYLQHEFSPVL